MSVRLRPQVAGLVIVLGTIPGFGDIQFEAEATLTIREPAASIVAADLDGDGRVDVGVVSSFGAVFALLNRGGELVEAGEARELGGAPVHIVSGDLDGDAHQDLVVTDPSTDSLFVLLGVGDGTFAEPRPWMVGFAPRQSAIGEFNGDGVPDLVAVNTSARTASVLFGRGRGEFEIAREIEVGSSPHSVTVGDFNEDRLGDIAVAIGDEAGVELLTGGADGRFRAVRVPAGEVPRWLTSGDYDGDGHLDVAVGNQNSQNVQVLLGDGRGTFPREQIRMLDDPIDFLATARVDADEDLDLVLTVIDSETGDSRIEILPGLGDGRFAPATFTFTQIGTLSVDTGDFVGDGATDLIFGTTDSSRLTIVAGKGDGSFVSSTTLILGGRPSGASVGDVTGDAVKDIVAAVDDRIVVLVGGLDRSFERGAPIEQPGALFSDVTVGDLDGLAPLDFAAVDFAAGELHVYRGGGGAPRLDAKYSVGVLPDQVVLDHIDGDAILDVVVLNSGSNDLSLLLGEGDGRLRVAAAVSIEVQANHVAAGDLDLDARVDLVVAGAGSSEVLFGDGQGGFPRRVPLADDSGVAAAIGLLNADGVPDIAIAYDDGVRLVLGSGGGAFESPISVALRGFPAGLALAELNGDSVDEIVVAESGADRVEILARDAGADYSVAVALRAGDPRAVVVSDIDADGAQDVLTVDRVTESLTVIFGRTSFRRGDANVDGAFNLADAVFILNALFGGSEQPTCEKAADGNDDGAVNIGDPIFLLNRLFGGGAAMNDPVDACGVDPTRDALTCRRFDLCN